MNSLRSRAEARLLRAATRSSSSSAPRFRRLSASACLCCCIWLLCSASLCPVLTSSSPVDPSTGMLVLALAPAAVLASSSGASPWRRVCPRRESLMSTEKKPRGVSLLHVEVARAVWRYDTDTHKGVCMLCREHFHRAKGVDRAEGNAAAPRRLTSMSECSAIFLSCSQRHGKRHVCRGNHYLTVYKRDSSN